jgi:Tfp pilus assembly protein PilE
MHTEEEVKNHPIDVRTLTAPIITVISIIGFFMWLTYVGTSERADMRARIAVVESNQERFQNLEKIILELKDIVRDLQVNHKVGNNFSYTDYSIFCLKAQLMNGNWKCPDLNGNSMNQLNDADITRELERLRREKANQK